MKLKYVLILVPLAQSSPLVGDLGKLFNSSETNAGLLGSLPVVGPLIDGVFGQFLRGIPIVGEILGGNQGQPHIPQQGSGIGTATSTAR
ncbi:hypothetical protein CONCODRAFT_13560 [Conidiobolus coronatus NRRL 28638]|uniref:Uncharacterized protein n=1 Tax=Conidiobolus coronatus (strain ATCC 28846 / CBS 209.66 / NRRL 28638) TaxID=796925 RepID=A0A137NQG3_CONC2|nr:hypothetical protein CONCODRAFT_13560 [Conidiobolus coronatus NRRL 28638]|eukprot:KXN65006.1 hypothetical protein CONCODRAFT_13560 [Conidiobolus coronatus NRRL 28638]